MLQRGFAARTQQSYIDAIVRKAIESAADFMRRVAGVEALCCPRCKVGQLGVVQTLAGLPRLPAPHAAVRQFVCRGPP